MRHYFSEHIFEIVKTDIAFLISKIKQSYFEYDFQIRENYFNLYYRGNSIGKIKYLPKSKSYEITVHKKFVTSKQEELKHKKCITGYWVFSISAEQLHSFYSAANLKIMSQKVKDNNFQEEIAFEQMLLAANAGRPEFIIIDRQVKDAKTKLDLLALAQVETSTNYQFCVIEVKLGNNKELAGQVSKQLKSYQDGIENKFKSYKECYELNFRQKQELGLFGGDLKSTIINIVPGVLGIVVVGGYSGLAMGQIKKLKSIDPNIRVLSLMPHINPLEAK